MAQLFNRAVRVIAGVEQKVASNESLTVEIFDPVTGKSINTAGGGAPKSLERTITIEKLRMQFKIKKTSKKEPNECQLAIYNLSKDSRAKLTKGVKLIVEAGYVGTLAQVFSGDARPVDHVRNGPDWITKAHCGDGERAYRFSTVSDSFKAGTSYTDVFEKVANATGLDVTDAVRFIRGEIKDQFTRGFVAHGLAFVELDRLLKDRGLEYSIQDGRLQILRAGAANKETAIVLSPSTGLVGSPEHGTSDKERKALVLKARSLLQPGLKPGRKVRVESEDITGNYVCQTVTHMGDTAGGEWYSDVEAVPI